MEVGGQEETGEQKCFRKGAITFFGFFVFSWRAQRSGEKWTSRCGEGTHFQFGEKRIHSHLLSFLVSFKLSLKVSRKGGGKVGRV